MPNYAGTLDNLVIGDDYDVTRTVTNIPTGQTLSRAWLTIKTKKSDLDAAAIVQKEITTSVNPGVGQILDDGTGDLVGVIFFQLTKTNTKTFTTKKKFYDIQVLTNAGKIFTVEIGELTPLAEVTIDES